MYRLRPLLLSLSQRKGGGGSGVCGSKGRFALARPRPRALIPLSRGDGAGCWQCLGPIEMRLREGNPAGFLCLRCRSLHSQRLVNLTRERESRGIRLKRDLSKAKQAGKPLWPQISNSSNSKGEEPPGLAGLLLTNTPASSFPGTVYNPVLAPLHARSREPTVITSIMKPKELVQVLDRHVIGQEHAKRVLAVAIYNHYCRLQQQQQAELDASCGRHEKSNIMLIGPSGSGKTLLARTVARCLSVPFAMGDATTLTEAGYVGEDVDSLLFRLLESAQFNVGLAQQGIIFLDEVDKIARAQARPEVGRDVGGEGVQQALLKMLEGTTVSVQDRRRAGRDAIPFDTSQLLFILSGAFGGVERIVQSRLATGTLGFSTPPPPSSEASAGMAITGRLDAWEQSLETRDLIEFGLIPEFVGRVPVLAVLHPLDCSALIRTLTEPADSLITQYRSLFALNGVQLEFESEALEAIAEQAIRAATGARGLRGILERLLLELMYEAPTADYERVTITRGMVERGEAPLIVGKRGAKQQEK